MKYESLDAVAGCFQNAQNLSFHVAVLQRTTNKNVQRLITRVQFGVQGFRYR